MCYKVLNQRLHNFPVVTTRGQREEPVFPVSVFNTMMEWELQSDSSRHTVGLYWVPGHAGVRGNEKAD
jgi:ribonuclease HI